MHTHFPGDYSFSHGFKGEFLNYTLKCNRLKSITCSTRKKKKDKTRKILNITNSGYERYLEAIALLSVPPKNATLEIKARCDGLLLEARLITRHTGKPFPFQPHPFANRNETVRKQYLYSNHTQRQELRNLCRV